MKLDHGTEFVRELMGDEGKDQWLLVNPRMLIGLVGTVACYGWAFLVLGAMAALAITWALSDFFSRRRRVQYALALVCTAAGAAGLWLALPACGRFSRPCCWELASAWSTACTGSSCA